MIANNIVNRMGPSFVKRVQVDTNARIVTIARAYTVARQIIKAGNLFETIETLDYKIPARAQMSMMFDANGEPSSGTRMDRNRLIACPSDPQPPDMTGHAR